MPDEDRDGPRSMTRAPSLATVAASLVTVSTGKASRRSAGSVAATPTLTLADVDRHPRACGLERSVPVDVTHDALSPREWRRVRPGQPWRPDPRPGRGRGFPPPPPRGCLPPTLTRSPALRPASRAAAFRRDDDDRPASGADVRATTVGEASPSRARTSIVSVLRSSSPRPSAMLCTTARIPSTSTASSTRCPASGAPPAWRRRRAAVLPPRPSR